MNPQLSVLATGYLAFALPALAAWMPFAFTVIVVWLVAAFVLVSFIDGRARRRAQRRQRALDNHWADIRRIVE